MDRCIGQYCRKFKHGDIISILLDCNNKTLSYGTNDEWYGYAFNNLHLSNCSFYIKTKQRGIITQLLT